VKPTDLVLRCYAEKAGDQWQAFCLDFCLAAQGDTLSEAKEKLESMIAEYVYDALAGEDRDFGPQLLSRRALCANMSETLRHCKISVGRRGNHQ
jgi:predicted RNase H-like HicB family nuclease